MTFLEIAAAAALGWLIMSFIAAVVLAALTHRTEPMAPAEPEDELAELFCDWPERRSL